MSARQIGSPLNDRLTRLEYLAAFLVTAVLFVLHWTDIRWWPAIVLFISIDLIGYLPGLAVHWLRRGQVPRVFHVLYNVTHSLVTAMIVVTLWGWLIGWEWALLAVPLHLLGDRGLLGNLAKPLDEPFETPARPTAPIAAPALGRAPS